MNTLNFDQSGGFPIETEIFSEMQTAWSILNALGAIAGNFTILQGCTVVGTTVSDGVVFINGEVIEFKGGQLQDNVIIVETPTVLEFEDLSEKEVIYTRHATFGVATTQYPWSGFKKPIQTRVIPTDIVTRLEVLEKKNAVFQSGGGMVFWNKPAAEIPEGWAEVVDWRGRMPVGFDESIPQFDALSKEGGSMEATIAVPISGYGVGGDSGGLPSGQLLVSSGANESGEFLESVKKASSAPGSATVNILNPYRTVLFIEYIL